MTEVEIAEHKKERIELNKIRSEVSLTSSVLVALIASAPYMRSTKPRLMDAIDVELDKLLDLREKQASLEILDVQRRLR